MKARKMGAIVFGAAALLVIGYSIYNIVTGKDVGFQEVIAMGALMMMFFSSITWGNKAENDGFFMDDELGQKITEKSSKISYFVLVFLILAAVFADEWVNGTINVFLLAVLGLSMVILPFVEFLVAKKYR